MAGGSASIGIGPFYFFLLVILLLSSSLVWIWFFAVGLCSTSPDFAGSDLLCRRLLLSFRRLHVSRKAFSAESVDFKLLVLVQSLQGH